MNFTSLKNHLIIFKESAKVTFDLHRKVTPLFAAKYRGELRSYELSHKEEFRRQFLGDIDSGHVEEFVFVAETTADEVHVLYCSYAEEILYSAPINRDKMSFGKWTSAAKSSRCLRTRFLSLFEGPK